MPINLKPCRNVVLGLMVAGSACLAGVGTQDGFFKTMFSGLGYYL
jgi:hypothetical protein